MDSYQAAARGHREAPERGSADFRKLADGRAHAEEERAREESDHKIGTAGVVVLLVVSILLDILSVADVLVLDIPVADIVATACSAGIWIYLLLKGIPSATPMVRWIGMYLIEWIPGLDWLPFYVIGAILIIAADRNAVVAAAVKYVPSKSAVKGRAGGRFAGSKLEQTFNKNKVFGAASERTKAIAEHHVAQIRKVQDRIPGKLRSSPSLAGGVQAMTGRSNSTRIPQPQASQAMSSSQPSPSAMPKDTVRNPFMDAYTDFTSLVSPTLEEILEADVDVTGEKAVERAAKEGASVPNATKKVQ